MPTTKKLQELRMTRGLLMPKTACMNMRPSRRRPGRPVGAADSSPPASAMPSRGRGRASSDRGSDRGPDRAAERGRAEVAPRGTCWLYGTHAVMAALSNPHRHLRQLLTTAEAQAALEERMGRALPIQPQRVDRARIDSICGRDAVHQGIVLLADLLDTPALEDIVERPGPVLLLDQVTDPRNIGAILRSAAAFGAAAVIVQDRNAPEETGALAKAASGALEVVPLVRVVNLSRTIDALKSHGMWTVGLDAGGGILDGASFRQRRVALVLGAEGAGLRRLTREHCDEIAGLAMSGDMESLNVSNAAAVALYEMSRPRG